MQIINFELLKHPMNWIVIILMVLIAGVALHLVLGWNSQHPAFTSTQ